MMRVEFCFKKEYDGNSVREFPSGVTGRLYQIVER
jgi:hypothetical protein